MDRLAHHEGAGEICVDYLVPFSQAELVRALAAANAGIVYEDVETAVPAHCFLHHGLTIRFLGDIHGESADRWTDRSQLGNGCSVLLGVAAGNHDGGAAFQ